MKTRSSKTLFFALFKQILVRILICISFFFVLITILDFTNNYPNAKALGYSFSKFFYFEIFFVINILSEGISFIVCIAFIWFFVSFSISSNNRVALTFGLDPWKIISPAFLTIILCILFYLILLKSVFINVINEAQYLIMDFEGQREKKTVVNNVTVVQKNDETRGTTILYLNSPTYKAITNKMDKNTERKVSYEVFPKKISIITYSQTSGVQNWQTFDVIKITEYENNSNQISISLKNPNINDVLVLQQAGLTIFENNAIENKTIVDKNKSLENKNESYGGLYKIIFNCNINFLINQIDIENQNIFSFSFVSLPLKIAKLKLQKLSYSVFEHQFYSTLKNGLIFILSLLIPMYFLFNMNVRNFALLKQIIGVIVCFLFAFVVCYFLSNQASVIKDGFLIAMLNIIPISFFILIFTYLNIKKHF
jgi:lipopolysaccharide export LptBFGC system permease protein LptF